MSSRSLGRSATILSIVALLALPTAAAVGQSEAESLSAGFRKAARRALPAVVTVRAAGGPDRVEPFPGGPTIGGPGVEGLQAPRQPGGSGVVIDARKGLILTNDHVVQGATRVVVTLPSGREREAREVRRDPQSDLALLTIDPAGLQQADWGDSDALETGDWVLAVGQPFGLSGTVTAGIVSGKGRGLGAAPAHEDLIQTDAAIHPGNSGGPLINLKGEVVGINVAFKSVNGGNEGIGFAVPAARARRVATDLSEFGRVRRSYLGIEIRRVDPEAAERLDQPGAVAVAAVAAGSPAEAAGLRPGDLIVKLGGRPVEGTGMFRSAIEAAPAGEPMALTVVRDGEPREVQARPKARPEARTDPGSAPVAGQDLGPPQAPPEAEPPLQEPPLRLPAEPRSPTRFPTLGLRLAEPTPALIRRFGLGPDVEGLVVVGVEPDGAADRGGLELGMVVTDLARQRTRTLPEFRAAMARRPAGRDLVVRVLKGAKAEFRVLLDAEAADPAGEPAPPPAEPPRVRPPDGPAP